MKCRPCKTCGEDNISKFTLYRNGKPMTICRKCRNDKEAERQRLERKIKRREKAKNGRRNIPEHLRLAFHDFVADVAEEMVMRGGGLVG